MQSSFSRFAALLAAPLACVACTHSSPTPLPEGVSPGQCGSGPYLMPLTKLSPNGATIFQVLSDDTTLVIAAQSGIFTLPKVGGVITPLVGAVGSDLPGFQLVGAVGVVGPTVYYSLGTSVMSVPKAGGTPTTVATLPGTYSNLTIDASGVYYVTGDSLASPPVPYALQHLPLAGGTPTQVTALPGDLANLGVDSGFVYMEDKKTLAISRVAATGGSPASLGVTGADSIFGSRFTLTFDASDLYYPSSAGVSRVAKDGSGASQFVSSYSASWLAIEGGTAYGQGIDQGAGNVEPWVWATPVTGGSEPDLIACAQSSMTIQGMGIDSTNVYVAVTESATGKAGIFTGRR